MRKTFLSLFILFGIISVNAQTAENPFVKYGFKKVRAYSFSKGEFEEFHDNKEIVEIGLVLFNAKTKEVIGYIDESIKNDISSATPAITVDPQCERYPWISPYAFCLNNPVRFVDPDGRDVWELNSQGEIINRISDRTQDAFYIVAKNADGNYQRTQTTNADGNAVDVGISFENGTVTAVRNPTVYVQNSDGSITPTKLTTFEMKGDDNATQLFEFMANPGTTTNIEWSHAKTGRADSASNIVGTSHEQSSTAVGGYLRDTRYTLREVNHNHPSGVGRPSGVVNADGTHTGDLGGAALYHGRNINTVLNIYTHPGRYFRYNQNGLITP